MKALFITVLSLISLSAYADSNSNYFVGLYDLKKGDPFCVRKFESMRIQVQEEKYLTISLGDTHSILYMDMEIMDGRTTKVKDDRETGSVTALLTHEEIIFVAKGRSNMGPNTPKIIPYSLRYILTKLPNGDLLLRYTASNYHELGFIETDCTYSLVK